MTRSERYSLARHELASAEASYREMARIEGELMADERKLKEACRKRADRAARVCRLLEIGGI